eukprot:g22612.t1
MRLQAMTQFMQNTAAGSLNGYGQHHPGQSHPFAEASMGTPFNILFRDEFMTQSVQISAAVQRLRLGSLRSLSSNSLPSQVDDDDDLQDRGIPPIGMGMGMPMGVSGQHTQALKVKNTFYDYETDCTPLGSRLETGLGGLTSMATVPSVISPSSAPPGVSDLQQVGGLSPNSDPLRRHDLADGLGSLFTVKNTFIECEDDLSE